MIKLLRAEFIKRSLRSTYPSITWVLGNDSDPWCHPRPTDLHLGGSGLAFPTRSLSIRPTKFEDHCFVGYGS